MSLVLDGSNGITMPNSSVSNATCVAWVCFNNTTSPGTIIGQYNVTSVTKNGTGDYTANFTNALIDTNYASVGSASYSNNSTVRLVVFNESLRSTTQCQFSTLNGGATQESDSLRVSIAIFR